ncbi:HD-GYP domain-containing protein [Azohydromonas sediminis]|uniref:HD-GYP domain-containing protein n=1 Tax=Azohydromonas sediminis TaxID=2259674 RepID=UPI000E65E366|nr:HD domain-containing phosphohydrolase [Azohydromonas sediminis]
MSFVPPAPQHLARAVAELGRRRPVIVSKAIYNTQGIKVIEAGVAVDERVYERLLAHQLATPLEESVGTEPSVNGAVLRRATLALIARQPLFERMVAQPLRRDRLLAAIEAVPLPRPIAFQLTLMHELQPALFQHAVAGALTAAWLGDEGLATQQDLTQIAAAALLRDLGMMHIDPVLLQPAVPLSRDQRRQLYAHPLVSAMLLERHHPFSRELIRAVLEHHEALDGSGYPRQLEGDAITPWGRVLGAADLVAAQHALAPDRFESRLSLKLRMSYRRLDATLVRRLFPLLAPGGAPARDVPLDAVVQRLQTLQQVLSSWPPGPAGLSAERQQVVRDIEERCHALVRMLAAAGAAPEQLPMLVAGGVDRELAFELSLLAEEAAWQLRAIGRLARRRWRLAPGETFPDAMQAWLDDAEAAVGDPVSA